MKRKSMKRTNKHQRDAENKMTGYDPDKNSRYANKVREFKSKNNPRSPINK